MELIGTCEMKGFTVEAYFPERGKEDIWVVWVVRGGHVIHEAEFRMEVESPYGVDHAVMAALERTAVRAVEAALRKEARPRRKRGWRAVAVA